MEENMKLRCNLLSTDKQSLLSKNIISCLKELTKSKLSYLNHILMMIAGRSEELKNARINKLIGLKYKSIDVRRTYIPLISSFMNSIIKLNISECARSIRLYQYTS